MSRKTFIIDTNVLLYDPRAIREFKENDVVIPLYVLEELDGIKKRPDELGSNSREVIRYVDSLKKLGGDFQQGIQIPKGPTVHIHLPIKQEHLKGFPLPFDRQSNKVLSVAYALKEKGKSVVFVSNDFVSRVKAEAMQIEAQDYESRKTSFEGIGKGIRKIKVSKQEVDQFYKDGVVPSTPTPFRPNEYCHMVSEEKSSALCRYNGKKKEFEPLLPIRKNIWGIEPLNQEQKCSMDLLLRDEIPLVVLMGPAGTGKTLLALACGMHKVLDEGSYSRILVSRPIVPLGKDIGYLPGTKEEKLYHWMQPIYDNLEFLCERSNGEGTAKDTLDFIVENKKLEMEAVTYIRGRSLPKVYMIIDEAQNLTPHEVKTIISRAGKGTKVILTGDPTQIDNPYLDKDSNGLTYTIGRFAQSPLFGYMGLDKTERSELAAIAAELL